MSCTFWNIRRRKAAEARAKAKAEETNPKKDAKKPTQKGGGKK